MAAKRSPSQAMVFFDIDGTLIRRAGPAHREALIESVRRVTGLETKVDGIPLHGMLDPEILTAMMRNAGASMSLVRRALPQIQRHAQALYVRRCPRLERKVCPGVRRLLNRLRRAGAPLGLVSGNFVRIGWKKVERAGLKPYFRYGAFAGMGKDRAALLRLAIRESKSRGWIGVQTRVALIGDTPRDVAAAQANRVLAVGVATGLSSYEELEQARPDILLEDLRQLDAELLLHP
ncbi:MAG TPA: HAD family hydrolase [Bryobacteraceae bacterium]|nr:HAD family hydrolase [Bryobacteraceae bacterium]